MKESFNLAPAPLLYFGEGKISVLPSVVKSFGSRILLVTGSKSFTLSKHYQELLDQLRTHGIAFQHSTIRAEPTPWVVDAEVKNCFSFDPEAVVAIGGGSVLDAGKAIAAMLPLNEPVKDYLEGVGTKPNHPGVKVPFIAAPTTAGTGSEAARNAVLSETGENGYKRSLRHNNFISNVAVIDPVLTLSCTPAITAASGMDAFTQLLESFFSTAGNSFTDALAYEGLRHISSSLLKAYREGNNLEARSGMALASYLSGITLTNAGLGTVHGFAASIGGYFAIPHGVICSSLMASVNKVTLRKLRSKKDNEKALIKYSVIGKLFAGTENKSNDYYIDYLINLIETWSAEMNIPRLGHYGIRPIDFDKIIRVTDNKNNPVTLGSEEMIEILEAVS